MSIAERVQRGIQSEEDNNQVPIYQLDLDEEVLAHLISPDSWKVFQEERFKSSLIEDADIRRIYEWQQWHVRTHGELASPTVIANQFDLTLRPPDTAIGDLLDRLRERYMKNHGRDALRHIVDEVFRTDPLAVPKELIKVGRELSQLLVSRGEMYGTGDFDTTIDTYHKKVARGQGPSFGLPELDEQFNGQHGVTFWLAPPKSYKSWMCVQCLALNLLKGKCVWHYSLELPAVETNLRLYHMLANVPWWKYIHNRLTSQDEIGLREAAEHIDGCGIYRIAKPDHGDRDIEKMVNEARDNGADLVIIDQLQYLENSKGVSLGELNQTGEYFGVLDKARTLSDEGPLLIAHQFHRNPGGYDSMPSVDHAKGSSSIEEVATLCLGMFQNKDMRRSRHLELGTLVGRNHDLSSWAVNIDLSGGCTFSISHRIEDDE